MKNNYNILKHTVILKYIPVLKELELNKKTFSNDVYNIIKNSILKNRAEELKALKSF